NVTMLAKNPVYQYTMGSHDGPSFKDIALLNKRYCSSIRCPDEPKCLNGGYRDPNNCTACKCPRGLAGDDCSQLAQNTQCDLQGLQLLHANSTNAYELRIPANQRANQTCYWRITKI
ncbi:Protein NAS-30, partial [Aphelenchoides avenae]